MEFEMPEADSILALPEIGISQLQSGDILFFSKKSPMQNMFWSVKDIWLHTAMVVGSNGELRTAEVGTAPEVFSRPIEDAVRKYEVTGVGRPTLPSGCVDRSVAWAEAQVGELQEYAWDDFVLAALVAVTRKGLPSSMLDELGAVLAEVAEKSDAIGDSSRTCAGFVHEAFARQGSGCPLVIDPTDTTRLGFFESTVTYDSLRELPSVQQDAILETTTLYDIAGAGGVAGDITGADGASGSLAAAGDEMFEALNNSRMSVDQLGRSLRTAVQIVDGFLDRKREREYENGIPGCWASPTDLWRSNQVIQHARLIA